jgi:hypothetical protein
LENKATKTSSKMRKIIPFQNLYCTLLVLLVAQTAIAQDDYSDGKDREYSVGTNGSPLLALVMGSGFNAAKFNVQFKKVHPDINQRLGINYMNYVSMPFYEKDEAVVFSNDSMVTFRQWKQPTTAIDIRYGLENRTNGRLYAYYGLDILAGIFVAQRQYSHYDYFYLRDGANSNSVTPTSSPSGFPQESGNYNSGYSNTYYIRAGVALIGGVGIEITNEWSAQLQFTPELFVHSQVRETVNDPHNVFDVALERNYFGFELPPFDLMISYRF